MELAEGLGINFKLLMAQVFNFLLLLLILSKFLYRPLIDLLDRRKKTIEESLKTAEKIKEEELALVEKKGEILLRAKEEAIKTIQEAKKQGEEIKEEIIKKAQEETQNILIETKISINQEREKSFQGLRKEIADLAILTSSRVIGQKLSQEENARIIEAVIKEKKEE